jgi:hypothetical protein
VSPIEGDGPNTRLTYQYRDASNFKETHAVVFAGRITDDQLRRLAEHLDDVVHFIAEQVGLPNLRDRWESHYDDDHVWHELVLPGHVEYTDAPPTDPRTVSDFVDVFVATEWDEAAAIDQLEQWEALDGPRAVSGRADQAHAIPPRTQDLDYRQEGNSARTHAPQHGQLP